MRVLILTICFFLFASPGNGLAQPDGRFGPVQATVLRIIDGDTIRVRAHIWLRQTLEVDVRLRDIDAPEMRGRCEAENTLAQSARERLVRWFLADEQDRSVILSDIGAGKYYGRVIARVQDKAGVFVGETLLNEKLAIPFRERRRGQQWCGDLS